MQWDACTAPISPIDDFVSELLEDLPPPFEEWVADHRQFSPPRRPATPIVEPVTPYCLSCCMVLDSLARSPLLDHSLHHLTFPLSLWLICSSSTSLRNHCILALSII